MTGKQLAQAEKERAEKRARAQVEWLREQGAWHWRWPGSGEDNDLPRNCWDTGLGVVKRNRNAHKCNFTQLPGSANGRNKRRARAQAGNSYRKVIS